MIVSDVIRDAVPVAVLVVVDGMIGAARANHTFNTMSKVTGNVVLVQVHRAVLWEVKWASMI